MATTNTAQTLHDELADITTDVVRTAARVCEAITKAGDALLNSDTRLVDDVVDGDILIDAECRAAEERVYELLGRERPTGADLRLLLAVLRLLHELARSGDLARNIAAASTRVPTWALPPRHRGILASMGSEARAMHVAAVDAWLDRDPEAAAAVAEMDDAVDALNRDLLGDLAGGDVPAGIAVPVALIARFYERLGDHAVAASAQVRYALTGER